MTLIGEVVTPPPFGAVEGQRRGEEAEHPQVSEMSGAFHPFSLERGLQRIRSHHDNQEIQSGEAHPHTSPPKTLIGQTLFQ